MKKVIKWTNKMSGETGYVKKVSKTYGHFVNTWEKSEAKIYQTDKQITKDMEILDEIGETVNNNFESVDLEKRTIIRHINIVCLIIYL